MWHYCEQKEIYRINLCVKLSMLVVFSLMLMWKPVVPDILIIIIITMKQNRLSDYFNTSNPHSGHLWGEVLLCAVKVQNIIIQTKKIYKFSQIGFPSILSDFWLQFVERCLGTAPPLVNQTLKFCKIILDKEARTFFTAFFRYIICDSFTNQLLPCFCTSLPAWVFSESLLCLWPLSWDDLVVGSSLSFDRK